MDIRKVEDGEKVKRWYQNNGGFKRFCNEVKRMLNIESNTFTSWEGIKNGY